MHFTSPPFKENDSPREIERDSSVTTVFYSNCVYERERERERERGGREWRGG
jgi:hypothetical protein